IRAMTICFYKFGEGSSHLCFVAPLGVGPGEVRGYANWICILSTPILLVCHLQDFLVEALFRTGTIPSLLLGGRSNSVTSIPKALVSDLKSGSSPATRKSGNGAPALRAAATILASMIFLFSSCCFIRLATSYFIAQA